MSEILIKEYRGDIVENVHRGRIAVVASTGDTVAYLGDIEKQTYIRSASKPIQVIPTLLAGLHKRFNLSDEEVAMFNSSHWGSTHHIYVLEEIARKTGINPEDMIMKPCGSTSASALASKLTDRSKLHPIDGTSKLQHCCSGKHFSLMLLQRELTGKVDGYQLTSSPVQKEILSFISMLSQTPTFKIGLGVDGCGVPVFALPLRSIALSYAKLADPFGLSDKLKEVIDYNLSCIHKHPEKINDYGTPSYYINQNPDLLMKDGSRGVICMAIKSMKLGIAIKLEDGWTDEFQGFIIANILQQLHYEDEELIEKLKKCYTDSLYNDCNIKVGHAVCDFKLNISESFFEDLDDSEEEDYSSENDRDFVESLGFDNEEDLGYDEEPDDGRGDGHGSRGDGRDSRGDGHGSRGDGRDSGLDDDIRDNVENPDDVEVSDYGRVLENDEGTDHGAGFNSDEQPLASNNSGIDSTSSTSQPQTSDNEANVNHDAAAKYEATDDDEDIDRIIALSEKKRQKNKPLSPEEAKELRNKNSLLGMNVVKPVTKRNIIVNPRVDSISQPIIMENSSEQNEPFEQETQAEQRWYSKQESEQEVHSAQETQAAQNKPYVQVKPRDGEMIYDEETNDIQNVSSSKEALSNSGSDRNQNLYDSSFFTPNKDLSQIKSANVISRKSDKN